MDVLIYACAENRDRVEELKKRIRANEGITLDTLDEILVSERLSKETLTNLNDVYRALDLFIDHELRIRESFFRLFTKFIDYDILIIDTQAFNGEYKSFYDWCKQRYNERKDKLGLVLTLDTDIEEIIRTITQYLPKNADEDPSSSLARFPARS